jgi:hypothetical protein
MIKIDKNPAGRISNIFFGLCVVIDGIIRIVSLGFLSTNLPLQFSRIQAKRSFKKR